MKSILKAGALAGALALTFPMASFAQQQQGVPPGVAAGAATGAVGGAIVGGPVGAAVGGIAGAVAGGIAEGTRPQFREYVVERRHNSHAVEGDIVVGTVLPRSVTYYEVPDRFGDTQYRYTIVNDRTVLVEPRTRRVVQIIE
ncbi:DUF1236 domain-containing protein [Phreatobacter sp.]|uniref:DUF1236 domain-containing protein n=1 Tax=Phreatobacter sp. TaxID=1966341 RepID=UPI003F6EB0E9